MQCVSANATTHHLLGAGTKQPSVNSVSTQSQLVSYRFESSCLPLHSVKKLPFKLLFKEMAFLLSLAQI